MNFSLFQVVYPAMTVGILYFSYLKNLSHFHPCPGIELRTFGTLSECCTSCPLGDGECWTIDRFIFLVLITRFYFWCSGTGFQARVGILISPKYSSTNFFGLLCSRPLVYTFSDTSKNFHFSSSHRNWTLGLSHLKRGSYPMATLTWSVMKNLYWYFSPWVLISFLAA